MKIGIIGTAGRGDDAVKLTPQIYTQMVSTARELIQDFGEDVTLVSGGAAYADHVAVELFLAGVTPKLELYLPCEIDEKTNRFVDTGKVDWFTNPGGTLLHYHRLFSEKAKVGQSSSLVQLDMALTRGAWPFVSDGFHARNSEVAKAADAMIAFTFGDGPKLKDGGTADTMRKFLKRRSAESAFHVDLHTGHCYGKAKV